MEIIEHTFSEQVKLETSKLNFNFKESKALLSGFLSNCVNIILTSEGERWEVKSQFAFLLELISRKLNELFNVETKIIEGEIQKINNKRVYFLNIKTNFDFLIQELELFKKPKINFKSQAEKRAYILGAFYSSGSINSIEKEAIYHLEIRSDKTWFLRYIQSILLEFNIYSTISKRKNRFFLYIKKADHISDFLKVISANQAMSYFEDIKISRDYLNQVQRLSNFDLSNMNKTARASFEQTKKIKEIINLPNFKYENEKFKIFCQIRLNHPEYSLKQIAEEFKKSYQIDITRTGLNHYVIYLKNYQKNNC